MSCLLTSEMSCMLAYSTNPEVKNAVDTQEYRLDRNDGIPSFFETFQYLLTWTVDLEMERTSTSDKYNSFSPNLSKPSFDCLLLSGIHSRSGGRDCVCVERSG